MRALGPRGRIGEGLQNIVLQRTARRIDAQWLIARDVDRREPHARQALRIYALDAKFLDGRVAGQRIEAVDGSSVVYDRLVPAKAHGVDESG